MGVRKDLLDWGQRLAKRPFDGRAWLSLGDGDRLIVADPMAPERSKPAYDILV